ncbi:RAD52 DNA repair protein RADC [Aspergillus brunneoviolaceus CBS 621.78]|uniref:Uncharacterized protein n=1 Tax=Aspergillus brunneoviolaceus CBS 621.78 TaxID=1450534 RepID=A0ACD1GCD2_9EURO|nr:hypothetical protein BO95DRAFT_96786 [Aspergillus brunneoviolaceus CBS 621.78]RAH46837.1 hypothetical protein BO95DRAFT_96786 [Aspergillus brunneoviolaceus CBS 621.78]
MPAVGDQHRGGPATIAMPNSSGSLSANPFEEPQRRISEYTAQEIATLQARLDKKLGPEYISSRPGAAGQRVHYLSADKCINLANEVFGFNGWSSSIQNIQIDFVEESQNTGKISLGLSVIVRVTLKDGTYHEDIGYGHIENCKGKAAAFEKAKKEGTTDALKRALRNFGNVLGNCIYDKDYVSKVTKVKAAPARWDVDELHRHPDFVPIKKEPVQPKPSPEDDDLPPRPAAVAKRPNFDDSMAFDGDGEFGSDLFDETDFGVTETGNPDEVVLGPESQRAQQPPTPLNTHQRPFHNNNNNNNNNNYRGPIRPNSAMVTPSKPPAPRQYPAPQPFNGRPNPPAIGDQQRPMPPTGPRPNFQNGRMIPAPSVPTAASPAPVTATAAGPAGGNNGPMSVPIKREPGAPSTTTTTAGIPESLPPGTPSASFFSARAVDLLRDNPHGGVPAAAPAFDPHAESPSIRKTAGFDHSTSKPISKPMLSGGNNNASPAAGGNPAAAARDFINPSQDMHRKIGAPGSNNVGSPLMNRGPSTTSSYRPLTRPNLDPRNGTAAPPNRPPLPGGSGPVAHQNANGKRPPLSDMTNAQASGGSGSAPGGAGVMDPKRPRMNQSGMPQVPPQQQQQQPQQPPHQHHQQ